MVNYIKANAEVFESVGIFFPFLLAAILKSAQALQENDAEEAWTNFGTAAKALNMWNTYNTGDGTTKAEAGSKRLQPFLSVPHAACLR